MFSKVFDSGVPGSRRLNGVVYDLRTQKLKFAAPRPEEIGITTVHFHEGSEGLY